MSTEPIRNEVVYPDYDYLEDGHMINIGEENGNPLPTLCSGINMVTYEGQDYLKVYYEDED